MVPYDITVSHTYMWSVMWPLVPHWLYANSCRAHENCESVSRPSLLMLVIEIYIQCCGKAGTGYETSLATVYCACSIPWQWSRTSAIHTRDKINRKASASLVKMALTGLALNKDRYVALLEKLIGETEFLQDNPPKFVPEEDKWAPGI